MARRHGRSVKEKGSKFERELSTRLSLWWSNGKNDDLFWKTSASGARATNRRRRNDQRTANQYGDITSTDSDSQPFIDLWTIEAKRGYNDCTVHDLIDRPTTKAVSGLEEMLLQAIEDCEASGSYSWMLIHQRDRRVPLIYMPLYAFNQIRRGGRVVDKEGIIDVQIRRTTDDEYPHLVSLVIMTLDSFFTLNPKIFRKMADTC